MRRAGAVLVLVLATMFGIGVRLAGDAGPASAAPDSGDMDVAWPLDRATVPADPSKDDVASERAVSPPWRARTLVRTELQIVAVLFGLLVLVAPSFRRSSPSARQVPADDEHRIGTRYRGPPLRLA